MKNFKLICLAFAMLLGHFSCNAQSNTKPTQASGTSEKVEVYYFHFTNRCVTCRTVESEAKADIESLYAGKVSFQSINLDEASSKTLAEKLQVEGQTLLIVKGTQKINITNEGFMYARSNPSKFKLVIKEKIDKII